MTAILSWLPVALAAPAAEVPAATDLRADALAAAKNGQPLVVLYSRSDCHFCEEVRRDHLAPLAASAAKTGLRVRQVDQDSEQSVVDFNGRVTRHERLAATEKVRLVPVVAFYGPKGERLSEAIVGARLPDFYGSYLERALEESRRKLAARK